MPSKFQLDASQNVLDLLHGLHKLSLEQEASLKGGSPTRFVSTDVLKSTDDDGKNETATRASFDNLMRDKFIALDEDKCHFIYQLIRATGATNIIEAGTSFGVSTIYLALAVRENRRRINGTNSRPGVIGTEREPSKAAKAREHWAQCGIEAEIDLREGNILETLSKNVEQGVDLLLLDIWTPLALPTLKLVQPKLRSGAVVLADNIILGADGYKDLLDYFNAADSDFRTLTLPYSGGLEMAVYNPK